jgi:hypothetical protein
LDPRIEDNDSTVVGGTSDQSSETLFEFEDGFG